MKIALVSDYGSFAAGITIVIENIVKNSPEDITYKLITWRDDVSEKLARSKEWNNLFETIELLRHGSVNAAIEEIDDCDLVFLQTCWNVRLLAVMASEYCRISGKPLVTALHTTGHAPKPASIQLHDHWFRSILKSSNHIVCVSDAVKRSIVPYIDKLGLSVNVIDNASRFQVATKEFNGNSSGRKRVSFIGRPTNSKGIIDFVKIAESLSDTNIEFICNSVHIDAISFLDDIPKNVQLVHSLGDEQMLEFYEQTDVLVATYRHSEGLPLVLLEALSLGIPVLGYNSPGVTDLLSTHHQFGVEVGDFDKISHKLREWYQGKTQLTLPDKHSIDNWSTAANGYISLFEELVA